MWGLLGELMSLQGSRALMTSSLGLIGVERFRRRDFGIPHFAGSIGFWTWLEKYSRVPRTRNTKPRFTLVRKLFPVTPSLGGLGSGLRVQGFGLRV